MTTRSRGRCAGARARTGEDQQHYAKHHLDHRLEPQRILAAVAEADGYIYVLLYRSSASRDRGSRRGEDEFVIVTSLTAWLDSYDCSGLHRLVRILVCLLSYQTVRQNSLAPAESTLAAKRNSDVTGQYLGQAAQPGIRRDVTWQT